jgi:hypothetical protein
MGCRQKSYQYYVGQCLSFGDEFHLQEVEEFSWNVTSCVLHTGLYEVTKGGHKYSKHSFVFTVPH